MIGFDADQDCSGVADAAVAAGAGFVCRYLTNLTLGEAKALSAAGLKIVSIFESTAERARAGKRMSWRWVNQRGVSPAMATASSTRMKRAPMTRAAAISGPLTGSACRR